MDKKGVNEIRKLFDKNDCRVDHMWGCYVDDKKQRIAELKDTFYRLQDNELFKYCEIFKKAVSGRIGRTLFNMEFPLSEEHEGGHQPELYALLNSGLQDEAMVDAFFQKIIDTYLFSGKYLILLVHGIYDVPGRTSDGIEMADASDFVYSFLELSVCPVELMNDGLCYDAAQQEFFSRMEDWAVQKPEVGMLYPAFNDRSSDIHAALWYAKNEKCRHDELAEALLGLELPRPRTAERDVFHEVIEIALGDSCDYENVKSINEAVNQFVEAGKDNPEPVVMEQHDIRRILYDNGADQETIDRFDKAYEEVIGGDTQPILAENVAEPKKVTIESDDLKLEVKPEAADQIETKFIDGKEYFLIPVTDAVTVNGIRIRRKDTGEAGKE